jgi:hypothetical protein
MDRDRETDRGTDRKMGMDTDRDTDTDRDRDADNLIVEKLYNKGPPRKCTQEQCQSVFIKHAANYDRLF